jgi:hypothetical protein
VRHIFISLLAALAAGSIQAGLPIVTVCRTTEPCDVHGTLVLRDGSETLEIAVQRGKATLDDDVDRPWEAELRAPGFWMPKQRLAPTLEVWRTGTLRGRFIPAATDQPLPSSFQLVLESPPHPTQHGPIARGTTVDCAVAENGAWSCEVPAMALDVIVRARTFTPHYKWDVTVKPAAVTDLGTLGSIVPTGPMRVLEA